MTMKIMATMVITTGTKGKVGKIGPLTRSFQMAGKLKKIIWRLNVDTKFVFYVDRFDYIQRIQMLNRDGWGYLDLDKKSIGKIKSNDFIYLYSTYSLPRNAWSIPELSVHSV